MLTLSSPQFSLDPPAGGAELEKPVNLSVATIQYSGGQPVEQDEVRKVGAFIYRVTGGVEEIWDDQAQRWAPPPVISLLSEMMPLPLVYQAGDPEPWQGVLVAAGQQDATGAARFAKGANGGPVYRLRAFAHAQQDSVEHVGLSDASADLSFSSAMDNQRFVAALDTGNSRDCRRVTLVLKNANLIPAGYLEIRTDTGQEIEIANFSPGGAKRASVVLDDNGDIHLHPASGRNIVLEGTLEAERIRYQPLGGGPKQTL